MLIVLLAANLLALGPEASAADRAIAPAETVRVVLEPRERVVLSAEVEGVVVAIARRLGEEFQAGDTLLRLEDSVRAAEHRRAKAQLQAATVSLEIATRLAKERTRVRKAEAAFAAAKSAHDAARKLHADNVTSRHELDAALRNRVEAEADVALAEAAVAMEVEEARRRVALAEAEVARAAHAFEACHLRAPYAGRVARVFVALHARVEPGQALVEIVDDRVLHARFLAPVALARRLPTGATVRIRLRERVVQARILLRSPVVDPGSRTREVVAELENPERAILAGATGVLLPDPVAPSPRDGEPSTQSPPEAAR